MAKVILICNALPNVDSEDQATWNRIKILPFESIFPKDKKIIPKSIEEQYKRKSLHQHMLDLPDTYIGSVEKDNISIYVYDDDENRIIKKEKQIVLELYKIFEISLKKTF